MKQLILKIALLLSIPALSFAQNNFKPGYMVILKNDTVKGFVDYKEWQKNPKFFYFKSNLADHKPQKFSVDNANSFAITGYEYYQKAIVKVSNASTDPENLLPEADTSYSTDTVFLKALIIGKKASLYSFTDNVKTRFYIQDGINGQINELNYVVYLHNVMHAYRNQLIAIATIYKSDYKVVQTIGNADYTEPDIRDVVQSINGAENQQVIHKSLFGARFFIGASVKVNQLNSTGNNGPFQNGTNGTSTYPSLSAGFDLIFNKNTQKIIFRAEVSATNIHFNFPYHDVYGPTATYNFDIKQFTASLTPQVIYNFYSTDNFKMFIGAGIAVNLSSYGNYYYVDNYNNAQINKISNFPKFESTWFSYPFKIGVTINKKVELYGAYYLSSSVTQYGEFSANIATYQAGINYLFGTK